MQIRQKLAYGKFYFFKNLKISRIFPIYFFQLWLVSVDFTTFFFFCRREFGLERFVPTSLIDGMKRKELRRLVSHFLKLNSQMTGSSTKVLTQLQAKIHYLDIISGLPSYGAKCFSTNQRDGVERVLLVSPRFGLSQIAGSKNSVVRVKKQKNN